jgi:hypothetical protein
MMIGMDPNEIVGGNIQEEEQWFILLIKYYIFRDCEYKFNLIIILIIYVK